MGCRIVANFCKSGKFGKSAARSGLTLAEILVATAVTGVVLATLAGVYESSSRISRRNILQNEIFAEAMAAVSTIENSLRQISHSAEPERWTGDMVSVRKSDGTIWTSADLNPHSSTTKPVSSPKPQQMVERTVHFKFASEFDGFQPLWKDSAETTPRLVHFEVTAQLLEQHQPRGATLAPVTLAGSIALD